MVTFKKKRGIWGFRGAVLEGGNYISVIWAMKYIQLYSDLSLSFYTNMCVCVCVPCTLRRVYLPYVISVMLYHNLKETKCTTTFYRTS